MNRAKWRTSCSSFNGIVTTDMQLEALLAAAGEDRAEESKLFARLIVAVIEELDQGLINALGCRPIDLPRG